jgi:hypothetical protein
VYISDLLANNYVIEPQNEWFIGCIKIFDTTIELVSLLTKMLEPFKKLSLNYPNAYPNK